MLGLFYIFVAVFAVQYLAAKCEQLGKALRELFR